MDQHQHLSRHDQAPSKQEAGDFTPLLIIFITVILFTLLRQLYIGIDFDRAMYDFMGSFFFILGSFKLAKWDDFADAFAIYDIVARKSRAYTYAYPLIEVSLGMMYLMGFMVSVANFITLVVMIVSGIGVALELRKERPIQCACLGTVFNVPMTKVTLFEDVLMGAMALYMLLR